MNNYQRCHGADVTFQDVDDVVIQAHLSDALTHNIIQYNINLLESCQDAT